MAYSVKGMLWFAMTGRRRIRCRVVPYTVVVVLHDSAPELGVLLRSVDRHAPERPQVVVVDSGSRDDGAAVAAGWGADVVDLPDNPGFGAASNAGVARARHDVCVLLN